jgi:hypothetical protein
MMRPPKDETEMRQELREGELEREEEEEERSEKTAPLKSLIPDDPSLYEAMEYFLLGSPKRQLEELGDPAALKRVADEAKSSGNDIAARINYESAAKIALYEHNRDSFKSLLELADEVTSQGEEFKEFHRTLLNNADRAMKVADEYYASFRNREPVKPKTEN